MKKSILLFSIIISLQASSQDLKNALFGGKLKNDSNSVVKKTDDLATKIDTARKKPVEPEKKQATPVVADPTAKLLTGVIDATTTSTKTDSTTGPKDNNKIWKEFIDAIVSTLNTEVMGSNKVKKGDYFVIVDYAIEIDGRVTITNVLPTPENSFLTQQVKERLSIDTPRLNPVLGGNGQPRKANKRTNFTISSK